MAYEDFTLESRVRYAGQTLALNQIVSRINLEDIMPIDGPVEPSYFMVAQETSERRRRFIDMIAAEVAHALTEALFEARQKRL